MRARRCAPDGEAPGTQGEREQEADMNRSDISTEQDAAAVLAFVTEEWQRLQLAPRTRANRAQGRLLLSWLQQAQAVLGPEPAQTADPPAVSVDEPEALDALPVAVDLPTPLTLVLDLKHSCVIEEPLCPHSHLVEVRVLDLPAAWHLRRHFPVHDGIGTYLFERRERDGFLTQVYRFKNAVMADANVSAYWLERTRAWLNQAEEVQLVQDWVCYQLTTPTLPLVFWRHPRGIQIRFQSIGHDVYWQGSAFLDALRQWYHASSD